MIKRLKILPVLVFLLAIFLAKTAFALPTNLMTVSGDASSISGTKNIRVTSDGTVYVVGTDTSKFMKFTADGTSVINYSSALVSHSGADFVTDGSSIFLTLTAGASGQILRYDISGTSASLVNTAGLFSGATSISYADSTHLYVTRSASVRCFDTTLVTSDVTMFIASSPARSMVDSSGVFHYISTAGTLRKVSDLTIASASSSSNADSIVASGLGASSTRLYGSPGGAIYLAQATSIRKFTSAGTILWTYATTGLTGMDIDSTGRIYFINSSSIIKYLSPISSVSSFNATPNPTSVDLSWVSGIADSDFSGVTIRRSTSSFPTSASSGVAVTADNTSSTYTDTGLNQGTTYYYTIFNETIDGYYDAGTNVSVTTTVDNTPTAAPSVFVASASSTSVNLSWANPVDSDFATVTIRRDTSGYPATIASGTLVAQNQTGTTYFDTGRPDGTYYYSIFAKDTSDNVSAAAQATATVDTTPPAPPTLAAELATPNGSTINLSWNVPATTNTFNLQHSTNGGDYANVQLGIANSTTTSTQTDLIDGTHTYKLFAVDSAGNISDEGISSTLTVDTTAPNAPTIVAALATPNGSTINLSWDVPASTNTFTLQRSFNGGAYSNVQTGIANSTTTYSATGLSDGTYTYKLYALDSAGNISNAGTSSTLTVDTTAPNAPTIVAALATPNGSTINLSWDVPSTTNTFTLQHSFNGGAYSNVQTGIANSTTTYNATGLSDGTYTYKLYALDIAGNISNAGTSSTLTIDTTAPSQPTLAAELATPNGSTINLSWDVPSTTNTFTLQRSFNGGAYSNVQTGIANATTTYSATGLSDGTYIYKLFALDSSGNISNAGTSSTLTVDATGPSTPSLIASTSDLTINLSWNIPATTSTFRLRRSTSGYPTSSTGTLLLTTANTSTTSYADISLANGIYYYSLFAVDSAGNYSSAGHATNSIDTTGPSPVTNVSAEVSELTIILSWTNPVDTDFDSVSIRRSTAAFPGDIDSGDVVADDISDTSIEDADLEPGTYHYSLFAMDTLGNVSEAANVLVEYEGVTPTVTTGDAGEIDDTGAILAGSISDGGTSSSSEVGFEYGESIIYESSVELLGEFSVEDFEIAVEDLDCGTTYHYRAYATNQTGTAYGQDGTFTTTSCADVSDLVFVVEAPIDAVQLNNNATFVVTIDNPENGDVTDTVVEFTLSNNLQFVSAEFVQAEASLIIDTENLFSASESQSVTCTGTNPVSCAVGTVLANSSLTLNITVKPIATGPMSLGAAATTTGDDSSTGGSTTTTSAATAIDNRSVAGSNIAGCALRSDTTAATGHGYLYFTILLVVVGLMRNSTRLLSLRPALVVLVVLGLVSANCLTSIRDEEIPRVRR